MNEEVEQEQSLGADGISESDQAASMAVRHLLNSRFIVYAQGGEPGDWLARFFVVLAPLCG